MGSAYEPEQPAMDLMDQLAGLNTEQRQAVMTTQGPVLILAGPGSGKTRTITFRIAYLIAHERVRPWNILAVTFTNKAAREMKERLEPLVGPPAKEIHVGTFHSICARVLRSEIETMDYGRTRNFTILDDDEQLTLIKAAIKDMNLSERQYQPRVIGGIISRAKNELLTPRQFAESANKYLEEIAARVYARYDEQLRAQNAADFDDLIMLTHQLWRRNPDALLRAQNRYHYIHVDEFQDCNRAQYELVRLLALGLPPLDGKTEAAFTGRRNLCVVGDEDQCLVAGTQITMADGTQKPIEKIRPGDQIRSAYGSGDFRAARVQSATRRDHNGEGICITMQSGRSLVSTPEHMHFAGYRLGVTPQTYFPSRNSRHMHIILTLCADRRGATPLHRISIDANDPHAQDALLSHGFRVRQGKPGTAGWRVEAVNSNLATVLEQAEQMCRVIDADIVFTARLGNNNDETIKSNALPFLPAASVRPGMVMFDAEGNYEVVAQVERLTLTTPVYDLNVEKTHNFIANGIITHNSIYAWRGASSKNILQFEKDFPDRQLIILGRNYRSTQTILDAAMHVVRKNSNRIDKELWTDKGAGDLIEVREVYNEEEEGRFVADMVRLLQARGEARLSECAVLYRTNAQSRAIEEQFLRAGVPYVVVGSRKFYERKEIRDVVAYLRLIANPRDITALQRIINVPARKIGEATVRQLLAWAEQRRQTPEEAIAAIAEHPTLGAPAKEALRRFATLMADLRAMVVTVPLDVAVDKLLERTGYASEIRDGSEEGEERWRNVLELRRVAGDYAEIDPHAALALFLENVALIGGADTTATNSEDGTLVNEPRDAVTLITLHAAKGLEFPIVFMVGMEEGVLPHSRSMEHQEQLEEERRLAYVGITRAMRKLYLIRAFRRTFYGGNSNLQEPSRFLGDIPAKLMHSDFKPSAGGLKTSATPAPSHGSASRTPTRPGAGTSPAPYVPRGQRGIPPAIPARPLPPEDDVAQAEPAPPPATDRAPRPGDTVRHRIYGKGLVLKVIAERDTTTVEVLFERTNIGKKTLDLSFARLEIVG
jgi:superfamily I DNA/RNA helicase